MVDTPRSRSISRASTPALARSPPSRFSIAPSLRPSPSLSNPHIHSHNLEPPLPTKSGSGDHVLDSSASSVIGIEPAEGILMQDIDADVDHTDGEDLEAIDKAAPPAQVEGTKKLLRDQLRKSLTHKAAQSGQCYVPFICGIRLWLYFYNSLRN